MITNSKITIYHKSTDSTTRDIKWTRYNYDYAWVFNSNKAVMNKGYDDANNIAVRIPYEQNTSLSINNFAIGDIIVKGKVETNIETQQDLSGYEVFNITSINNNNFGSSQHIHLGGR